MLKKDGHIQITQMINTINQETIDSTLALESYLVRLDIHQSHRPAQITETLQGISKRYPADALIFLEEYISALEASSAELVADNNAMPSARETNNPPYWSHERLVKRQQRRQNRASLKVTYT